MAIILNGIVNNLPASQIPAGYNRPTVTTFEDGEYPSTVVLEVLKATVENANPVTTMGNILNEAVIGLIKQLENILAADFLASATVEVYGSLNILRTNFSDLASDADYLKADAAKYICTVEYFVKTS